MEQRLLLRARAAGFGGDDRIVAGFSGGRDSLALAGAMRWVASRLGGELILVHVDHRLRESSGEEATRAERLAEQLGLRMMTRVVAAPPRETHPGVGMEEAARRERYRLLFAAAGEEGAAVVATAHHREDQAETVLLHLLRGGGVHGAAGMLEVSDGAGWFPPPARDISLEVDELQERQVAARPRLWRPFLSESRNEIDAWVRELGLVPILDPSNDDRAPRRNALRHEILPHLERIMPGAAAALARYATVAAAEDRLLDELAEAALADIVHQGGVLPAAALLAQPIPLQRRMVRRWIEMSTGSRSISSERTDAMLDLARSGEGRRTIEIGEGWTVRLAGGMLRVGRLGEDAGGAEE